MNRRRKKPASSPRTNWLSRNRVAAGASALLLVVVIVAFALVSNQSTPAPQTAQTNLDKSKGAANAPVTVIEYGDFQ